MNSAKSFDPAPSRKILLVDGHAYAYRAFYAIREMTGPGGAGTNGIFGFIRMIHRMVDFVNPTHVAVIWDGGLAPERLNLLPDYKADRPSMPPELDRQIEEMWGFLDASNITSAFIPGIEADDLIGTLTHQAVRDGFSVVIASSDKDFMQLVNDNVGLLNPTDKVPRIWGVAEVVEKSGVLPTQIVEWLSLIGDSVDNIPGVLGIGHKTATELLQKFGSIAGIFDGIDTVTGTKRRESLLGSKDILARNLELIRLHTNLDSPVTLQECSRQDENPTLLSELYSRWGFRSLLNDLVIPPLEQSVLF